MSNTLDLVLKQKWYDMIESGEKPEEYREIKPYWFLRLINYDPETYVNGNPIPIYFVEDSEFPTTNRIRCDLEMIGALHFKDFTHVRFHRGYTSTTMTFEIKGISIGQGREEWGAPKDKKVFIIKLGKKL